MNVLCAAQMQKEIFVTENEMKELFVNFTLENDDAVCVKRKFLPTKMKKKFILF